MKADKTKKDPIIGTGSRVTESLPENEIKKNKKTSPIATKYQNEMTKKISSKSSR